MSAYSIVNLKEEVEDSMGERAPGIEGRLFMRFPRRSDSPLIAIGCNHGLHRGSIRCNLSRQQDL
jgi:hypothetical protein